MSSKVLSIWLSKHGKMIEYHVNIRSTGQFKQIECVKKMTEMRSKVWNIDTNFVVFKNKYKDKSKNLCVFKFGVLDYRNTQNDCESCSYQIHRSFYAGWGA